MAKGALLGAVIGGVAGGAISALTGGSFWEGFENGAFSGAIAGIISGGMAFAFTGGIASVSLKLGQTVLVGAVSGAGTSLIGDLGDKFIKGTDISWGQMLLNTAFSAVLGAVFAGVFYGLSKGFAALKLKFSNGKANLPEAVGTVDDVIEGAGGDGKGTTTISPEMEKKVLWGQRKNPNKNEMIGGHSSGINNKHPNYAVEKVNVNPDGTKTVKYTTQLPDGKLSKIKKSTLFPDNWSDSKIIKVIKKIGNSKPKSIRERDGATWHREIIDSVEVDVIKKGDKVISAYPTGKVNAPPPSGFSK